MCSSVVWKVDKNHFLKSNIIESWKEQNVKCEYVCQSQILEIGNNNNENNEIC